MKTFSTKADLEKIIADAQTAYYNSTPILSDSEYDTLIEELREIDPENVLLKKVGAEPLVDSRLQKVAHVIPMGSLNKVNTKTEFAKWAGGKGKFCLQPKYDGISISLKFEKGKLVQAVTRGSGEAGEDVTHNLKKVIETLPNPFTGYIRGEVILPKSAFEQHFSIDYSNPRNTAAGITRSLDGYGAEYLEVKPYDIIDETREFNSEKEKVEALAILGVLDLDEFKFVGPDNAAKWYDYYTKELRAKLDYEIDGLVIKVNDLEAQRSLGEVDGRPKGQIAWKFAPEMKRTTLRDVLWQVGNTGRITPVAVFDPVKIGGVTIERASLHTASNIKNLNVGVGAEILISRRNDVIPYVEACTKPVEDVIKEPEVCPVCDYGLIHDGEYLLCPSLICRARLAGNLTKWIKVLDIEECGESFVEDVMKYLDVEGPQHLYELTMADLLKLPGYQVTKAQKILDNLNKSKNPTFELFLAALNIPNVSVSTFSLLKKHGFDNIEKLQKASINDLTSVPGIGDITAEEIINAFKNERVISLINNLFNVGVIIKEETKGKLTGMSFCFTGELAIKRPDAMRLVKELGGEVKSSVSKGLTYLVQANPQSTSSKSEKARKYGTKVIGESEFMDLVEFTFEKLLR